MLEETRFNPLPLTPRHLAQMHQCRLKFGEDKGCPCPIEDYGKKGCYFNLDEEEQRLYHQLKRSNE